MDEVDKINGQKKQSIVKSAKQNYRGLALGKKEGITLFDERVVP
jgi:hypothetical protein